jgi:hypothetical protein
MVSDGCLGPGADPPSTAGAGVAAEAEEPPDPVGPFPVDALPDFAVADPTDADTATDDPLHSPITDGWQLNPSPQSAVALQGSRHLNAQADCLVVVHVGSLFTGTGHLVPGAQGGIAAPPEQAVDDVV